MSRRRLPPLCPCGECDPDAFYTRNKSFCKACVRAERLARYHANPEPQRARMREYGRQHPEVNRRAQRKRSERLKAEREPRPPKVSAEHTAARRRAWKEANRERINRVERERYARKREHERARRRPRERARRLGHDAACREYGEIIRRDLCSYCERRATTVDHIDALDVGGQNDVDNLTGACRSCNSQKNTADVLTFMLKRAVRAA